MSEHRKPQKLADEWLVDFAAGNLSPAFAALVNSFLDLNEDAREDVEQMESVGGAMLEDMASAGALSVSAADLLECDQGPAEDVTTQDVSPDYIPASLRETFELDRNPIRWTFLGPGLRKALLWKGGDDERLWLLKAEPGVAIPKHTHRGAELTLVLKGAFSDGEEVFAKGDVEEADPGVLHSIDIAPGEECICLAATTGKLVFPAPHIKLMQTFLGI
jgi:putative transcriptional regulator